MTSVEQICEYTKLSQETNIKADTFPALGETKLMWPKDGEITFKNVNLKYAGAITPSLCDLNFTIKPGEKVRHINVTFAVNILHYHALLLQVLYRYSYNIFLIIS